MTRSLLFALPLLALASPAALAQQPQAVQVANVWARATPPGATTGAVYMSLTSPDGDRLTGVASPAAGAADVHEMSMDGNVMRMRPIEGGLDLPAGKTVTLQPGGLHVMLEHLKGPLKVGQTVPVRLTFQHAPPVDVTAAVQPIGAAGPAGTASAHTPMPGPTMGKTHQ